MTLDEIKGLVHDDMQRVNRLILSKAEEQIGLIDELRQYIISSGGKRLRPLVLLLCAHACQYRGEQHIQLAAMVEYFHTATLLHDDVIDNSHLRRGRATANEIWGNQASILVGDYLYTQSILLLVALERMDIIRLMADTSHKITCGEVKQMVNKHNITPSIEDYFEVIEAKTAVLFAACGAIGAMLADADEKTISALYQYGLHLGNAFQLIDDALDYNADAQTLGKNVGDDLAEGKATLPLIHALMHASSSEQALIRKSLEEGTLQHLADIQGIIKNTDSHAFTVKTAYEQSQKAQDFLAVLEPSPYKDALLSLATLAVDRAF